MTLIPDLGLILYNCTGITRSLTCLSTRGRQSSAELYSSALIPIMTKSIIATPEYTTNHAEYVNFFTAPAAVIARY